MKRNALTPLLPPNPGALAALGLIEYFGMAALVEWWWPFNVRQSVYQRPLNYIAGDGSIWIGFAVYALATRPRLTAAQALVVYSVLLGSAGAGTLTMYLWKWTHRRTHHQVLDRAARWAARYGYTRPPA